jgi:uncharacterized protein DUF4199
MKKTVLVFGVISGVIIAAEMLAGLPFLEKLGQGSALLLGYTTMVLAGLLVYFGIRSYRDNVDGGKLTFGRGFVVGILISLIACCFYVGTWEIVNYRFMPGFADKYAAGMVKRAKDSGASQQKIDETIRNAEEFKRNYRNPVYNVGMTFLEVFPVFLLITLISAGILRRKSPTLAAP